MVVLHALYALKLIHGLGLIHTDVKASDMLLLPDVEDDNEPIIEGEIRLQGKTYPILAAQPLLHAAQWDDEYSDAERRIFCLNDMGHVVRADQERSYRLGTPYALRAPEVILQAGYDCKIDTWAVGCMAFELLTGHWAFHPKSGITWSIDDDHLAQMQALVGETFSPSMLAHSELRDNFFNQDGILKNVATRDVLGIHEAIISHVALPPQDSKLAAEFIAACLHLDPEKRPSATELVEHSWLVGADWCRDYRQPPSHE
jgi:serine/threonine-protein kinase SRPK3